VTRFVFLSYLFGHKVRSEIFEEKTQSKNNAAEKN
jgi:hypothetical protein